MGCVSEQDLVCDFLEEFQMFESLVSIINTVVGSDEIDFWCIVGDNFYEQRYPVGRKFFQALSLQVKSKPFLTVPGNHDFWLSGDPLYISPTDQFGNGFMQYYGQDTEASLSGKSPFTFAVDPADSAIPEL